MKTNHIKHSLLAVCITRQKRLIHEGLPWLWLPDLTDTLLIIPRISGGSDPPLSLDDVDIDVVQNLITPLPIPTPNSLFNLRFCYVGNKGATTAQVCPADTIHPPRKLVLQVANSEDVIRFIASPWKTAFPCCVYHVMPATFCGRAACEWISRRRGVGWEGKNESTMVDKGLQRAGFAQVATRFFPICEPLGNHMGLVFISRRGTSLQWQIVPQLR